MPAKHNNELFDLVSKLQVYCEVFEVPTWFEATRSKLAK